MKYKNDNFFNKIKDAKKILVLDLGFLGDTVHILPTLQCIRDALPEVQLHVMVSDHIQSILQVVPCIDRILGYPRFPKGPKWYKNFRYINQLRAEGYDAIINVNGSDRSSFLTLSTGAPYRLGREQMKKRWYWPFCYTHTTFVPRGKIPVYEQNWQCLKQVGFLGEKPVFKIHIPEAVEAKLDTLLDNKSGFIHVSPFTTEDFRELPINQIADFLNQVAKTELGSKIILSCAPNDREQFKFQQVLKYLDFSLWKTFPGTLSLIELAGLINRSCLHMGGDSGCLHVSLMTNKPTLSWFYEYPTKDQWMPKGPQHRSVVGKDSPQGLQNISLESLMDAFNQLNTYIKTPAHA